MAGKKRYFDFRPSQCHPLKALYSKGMCETCWRRQNANVQAYMKTYLKEWRKRNKDKTDEYARRRRADPVRLARLRERQYESRVRVKYGLDREGISAMMESQGGACAICQQELLKPNIDHCHSTGVVRGLLCNMCNTGLGQFKDSIPLLFRAADYLLHGASKQATIDKLAGAK